MTEQPQLINVQNSSISIHKSLPSLEDFKALYYFMNAKPDTQIRLMQGKRIVDIAEIRKVNELIINKLVNHNVNGSITSINIVIGKSEIRDYSSWSEFERENWSTINGQTRSIMINWDLLIKLPQYEIPQRHTLKLRIGHGIPPRDMLHLVISSDDPSELMEAASDAVCKIDFINQVLAAELLAIMTNWYEGLHEIPKAKGIQNFLSKYQEITIGIVHNFTPVVILFIFVFYANFFCEKYHVNNVLSLSNINWIFLFFITMFYLSSMVAKVLARWLYNKIDSYREHSQFVITKGDEKAQATIKSENSNLTNEILLKICLALIGAAATVFGRMFIEYLLK